MKDIWYEICFELKSCIQNNVLEKDYEQIIVNCMMLLGWKKFKGEVVTQYAIQVGHEKKYADIVILQDGIESFVIEVKRPNHVIQEEDEKQLFSYMRLMKHRVAFGLYIGNKIRLYYDDIASESLPEEVFSVDIFGDNPDGLSFVELFRKDLFDIQKLSNFCVEQKKRIKEFGLLQNEICKILADKDGLMFKELLRKKYLEEGYSVTWSDEILKRISLSVYPTRENNDSKMTNFASVSVVDISASIKRSHKDKTKYCIEGGVFLPKNRFVLEVVRRYVNSNPKTYNEYVEIFNALRQDSLGVIEPLDTANVSRYFMRENERLKSIDGITFVVCTQWSIFNITPIIEFANLQGYHVATLNPDEL